MDEETAKKYGDKRSTGSYLVFKDILKRFKN